MRIAVLGYDQISPFMLSTPLVVFGESFLTCGHQIYVCSDQQKISAIGGLTIEVDARLRAAREADALILPGWRNADEPVSPEIVAELRAAGERGAIIAGLCLGAFGVAEAGLLNGKRATTHWAYAEVFAARYPKTVVDAGALFVDEGQILTSAGMASGLDCCLHLLSRISGAGESHRIARILVVAPQRTGKQPQIIERPVPRSSADLKTTDLLEALRANPVHSPSLNALAARIGMSRRSLTRHIRARSGGSLGDWLRQARLSLAQELLAAGARGLEDIAARCGFPGAHALRTAFRKEFGLTPTQWLARQRQL